jgi:hypothetical protein
MSYSKHNKKMRYQDDIFLMGGSHWSEAQVDGNAGIKPSTSLRSVAATQSQYFLRISLTCPLYGCAGATLSWSGE